MPSTYSTLKIQLMATGENNTTWGSTTNVNLGTAIEEAIAGSADATFASADLTLTLTDTNATQTARNMRLRLTGTTGGSTRNLIVPSIEKPYIVKNDCADSVVVKTTAGTGITVPAGKTMWVYSDATNVVDAVTRLTSLTLGTALAVADGGSGATTAAGARTGFGSTTVGSSFFTLANPSAITFPRINADNTVSALSAASFVTAVGTTTVGSNFLALTNPSAITFPRINADNTVSALSAASFLTALGGGSGTVTSVSGAGGTTGLTLTGGPITGSGTLTLGGTLAVANGGTGVTTSTGTGSTVLSASPTLTGTLTTVAITASGVITGSNGFSAAAGFGFTINGDCGITRSGAAVMSLGNGTSNDSTGTLSLSALFASSYIRTPLVIGGTAVSSTLNIRSTSGAGTSDAILFSTGAQVERFRILSTGGITSSDLVDAVGYKGLPQNSQTASYTLALSDMGKMVNTTTGGVVIPANASIAFPIGAAISIFNNSASSQTISITTDTLRQAGTATTGSRTLAQYGLATCVKVTSTVWAISGAGVS